MLSIFILATMASLDSNHQGLSLCATQNQLNPATLFHLRIVPSADGKGGSDVIRDYSAETTNDQHIAAATLKTQSGYARIVARFEPCRAEIRDYPREKRNIVRRLFMQKQVSKILTANLDVNPVGVKSTRPLMTISRDSGKAGEIWSTDIWSNSVLVPFFRIEPNSSIKLDLIFHSSRDYNSSIASGTLDLLKRATSLVTPNGTLITSLNKARFNEASNFVDTTINGLLKVSIDEKFHTETLVLDGVTPIATVILYAPGANDPYVSPKWKEQPVGKWTISAERFEGSLFSDVATAANQGFVPSPASALNFHVADDKSVRESLAGDSSVTTARDEVMKAAAETASDLARKLCRTVADKADALGFSATDVNWIVASYVEDMALPDKTRKLAAKGCGFTPYLAAVANK